MLLKKGQLPIIIVHSIALIIFTFLFISRGNYEFLWYIGVIIALVYLILATNHRVDYPNPLLWGLTIWSILHMSGGGLNLGATRLYDLMIYTFIGEPYNVLRYDQVVHAFGFAVATLLSYYLIKPILKKGHRWAALSIVIVMAGLGMGALNEIIEFFVTIITPNTGVGGYENTALDLVSNLAGALAALIFIRIKERKN